MTEAPYGSWRSPITSELIVSASIGIGQPRFSPNGTVYWQEGRPLEGGRNVIVRRNPDGTTEDVNPAPFNSRTRVHEYGGGDYVVGVDETVYFSNFADQRIYKVARGGEPVALTHAEGHRYADLTIDTTRHRIVCVREDHSAGGEPVNTVAAVDLATGDETVLVQGNDFYSNPRLRSDGVKMCWLSWDHPNMPWDGTTLHVANLSAGGGLIDDAIVAGHEAESVFQPEWSPDDKLYFVSDRSGWWNLYRWAGGEVKPLAPRDAEFGGPLWQFGASTYAFESASSIICSFGERGTNHFARLDIATGALADIAIPYTSTGSIRVANGEALFGAGSTTAPSALVLLDLATGTPEVLKRSSDLQLDAGYLSIAEPIEFPTEDGLTAFGYFYAPKNKDFEAPSGEKPPLLVMSHGGPTSATGSSFSTRIQYWTSRGIAVLDVNYGGSTGYGRAYRERLNGRWGIVDVDDCTNGALYLAAQGLVDGDRLAITGGSAGGYTTLCALTFKDAFKAGASHYGVGDLEALARDTHKFESRYLDNLIGPYPERRDLYLERSPIQHVGELSVPAVFFQGLEDKIVPPNQAEEMVAALKSKGVPVAYVAFEGEQHGFRQAANIRRSLDGEIYFYSRVFGFELAEAVEPLEIDNLP